MRFYVESLEAIGRLRNDAGHRDIPLKENANSILTQAATSL